MEILFQMCKKFLHFSTDETLLYAVLILYMKMSLFIFMKKTRAQKSHTSVPLGRGGGSYGDPPPSSPPTPPTNQPTAI